MDIPVLASGDEIVREESVPESWVEQRDRARDAKQYLEDNLVDVDGFRGTARTNAGEMIEGYHKSEIVVYADAGSELAREGVREELEGVPVSLRIEEAIEDTAYRQTYDPIKGGVHANSSSSTTGGHTATCRVKYNGDSCLMVPRHGYTTPQSGQARCARTLATNDCYQYGDHVGSIVDDWQELDVAVSQCNNSNRIGVSPEIVAETGSLSGHVTSYGVDVYRAANRTVHKRGINTGQETGTILDVGRTIPCPSPSSDLNEVVHTSAQQGGGDSGGPVYIKDDNGGQADPDIFLINLATQRKVGSPGNGCAMGVAAYHINSISGVIFN